MFVHGNAFGESVEQVTLHGFMHTICLQMDHGSPHGQIVDELLSVKIITPFPALIISRRAGADNKERESMSEKEKMQTEELAKIMDDAKPLGKSALSFMAGFVQGYKEAQSADPAENTGGKEDNEE